MNELYVLFDQEDTIAAIPVDDTAEAVDILSEIFNLAEPESVQNMIRQVKIVKTTALSYAISDGKLCIKE